MTPYFARVLTYAPDPLISFPKPDQVLVKQEDPPLATPCFVNKGDHERPVE